MPITYTTIHSIPELVDAMMLRVEVFVVGQNTPHEEEPDEFDRMATHIVAKDGERIIGTARFRSVAGQIKIERIAVREAYRRQGVGTGLVRFILDHVDKRSSGIAYLHAQTAAEGFYRSLGFQPVGERFMEAGIEHVKMVREI
jgi:predicted GNAT family N-acyltransferase